MMDFSRVYAGSAFVLAMLATPACQPAQSGGSETETGQTCPVGGEACPCTPGGACDTGLVCLSDYCVADPAGESSASGADESPSSTGDDSDGTATGDGDGDSTTGDGDGDSTTGDGDGDSTTGDGDGDGDATTGDGDGDATTGDGDGDATTGDGDGDATTGDGDGDATTGDGDGDATTGDGDGDASCQLDGWQDGELCVDFNEDDGDMCTNACYHNIEWHEFWHRPTNFRTFGRGVAVGPSGDWALGYSTWGVVPSNTNSAWVRKMTASNQEEFIFHGDFSGYDSYAADLVVDADGAIIWTGRENERAMIKKVNPTGGEDWGTDFAHETNVLESAFNHIAVAPNGDFVACGLVEFVDSDDDDQNAIIGRYRGSGAERWLVEEGVDLGDESCNGIAVDANSDTYAIIKDPDGIWFTKYGFDGTRIDEYTWDAGPGNHIFVGLEFDSTGNLWFAMTTSDAAVYTTRLGRIDPGLNGVTDVVLDVNLWPYDLKVDADDDIVVAGALRDAAGWAPSRWGVVKARPDGSLVWVQAQHTNGTVATGHASSVFITSDDRVFVTGSITKQDEVGDDMYTRVFQNFD